MKKIYLVLLIILGAFSFTKAQNGWVAGNIYAFQGESVVQNSYQTVWNPYYGQYVKVRTCRVLNWYREYHR